MTDVGLILFGGRFLHSAMPGIASVEMTEKWRAVHTLAVEIRLTDDG